MDAFACEFCRHIFTLDDPTQSICFEDHAQQLKWQWNGSRWRSQRPIPTDWLLIVWGAGVIFVALPTLVVWLSYHTFPPLPSQGGLVFPLVWTGLTFAAHLGIVGWLVLEHYQFPLYITLKLYWGRFWHQFSDLQT